MPGQISENHNTNAKKPNDDRHHHRLEVLSYAFLSIWITADILTIYGHNRLAVLAFYFALLFPLVLLTHHANNAWPKWRTFFTRLFVLFFLCLPIFLFTVSFLATFSVNIKIGIFNFPDPSHDKFLPPKFQR